MSRKYKISICILLILPISLIALSILFHSMEASDIKLTKLNGDDKYFNDMNIIYSSVYNRFSQDYKIPEDSKTMGINQPVLIKTKKNKLLKLKIEPDNNIKFLNGDKVYKPIESNDSAVSFKKGHVSLIIYNKYTSMPREYNITSHINDSEKYFNESEDHRLWKYLKVNGKDYFLICHNKNNSNKIKFFLIKLDPNSGKSELVLSKEDFIRYKYDGTVYIFEAGNRIYTSIVYKNSLNDVFEINTDKLNLNRFSFDNKNEKIMTTMGILYTNYKKDENIVDIYMEQNNKILKNSYSVEEKGLKFISQLDTKMHFPGNDTYIYKNKKLIHTVGRENEIFYKLAKGSKAMVSFYTDSPYYKSKGNYLTVIKKVNANVNEMLITNTNDYFFNSEVGKKNNYIVYIYDIKSQKIMYCGILSGTDITDSSEIDISNISK